MNKNMEKYQKVILYDTYEDYCKEEENFILVPKDFKAGIPKKTTVYLPLKMNGYFPEKTLIFIENKIYVFLGVSYEGHKLEWIKYAGIKKERELETCFFVCPACRGKDNEIVHQWSPAQEKGDLVILNGSGKRIITCPFCGSTIKINDKYKTVESKVLKYNATKYKLKIFVSRNKK